MDNTDIDRFVAAKEKKVEARIPNLLEGLHAGNDELVSNYKDAELCEKINRWLGEDWDELLAIMADYPEMFLSRMLDRETEIAEKGTVFLLEQPVEAKEEEPVA